MSAAMRKRVRREFRRVWRPLLLVAPVVLAAGRGLPGDSKLTAAPVVDGALQVPVLEMSAEARAAVDRGLKHLAEAQQENGSLGARPAGGEAAIVGLAGMAFLAADSRLEGGVYSHPLARCQKFVLAQARPDGYIGGNGASMYVHAIALAFLIDLQERHPNAELKATIEKGVVLCQNCQNAAGGWRYQPQKVDGDASVTACVLVSLAAARRAKIEVSDDCLSAARRYLLGQQNADGGFSYTGPGQGSALGRSAEAAAALALLASGADDPGAGKLRAALGYVQSTAAELRPRGDWMSMYSYFSVSQALADQPDLVRPWYLAASTQLIAAQQADGSWSDPAGSGFASAAACLTLQLPRWARGK